MTECFGEKNFMPPKEFDFGVYATPFGRRLGGRFLVKELLGLNSKLDLNNFC
jgi:hypothetical protein